MSMLPVEFMQRNVLDVLQRIIGFILTLPLVGNLVNLALATLCTLIRCGDGLLTASKTIEPKPAQPFILYEFESCPYCAKEPLFTAIKPPFLTPCPTQRCARHSRHSSWTPSSNPPQERPSRHVPIPPPPPPPLCVLLRPSSSSSFCFTRSFSPLHTLPGLLRSSKGVPLPCGGASTHTKL